MKKDIHPEYFADSKVSCVCGAKFNVGSTKEKIDVEICGACHPFFTGGSKVIDSAGRVERFKMRQSKVSAGPKKKKTDKK